jgi:3-dehydroquinate synthase
MRQLALVAPPLVSGRPNLVLTGLSATGKTSAGALVALRLGMPFLDLDQAAERRTGLSVGELFAARGEVGFRELEGELLSEASRLSGTVVATGGGAVLHTERFAALASRSVVVVLTAPPQEIEQRLAHGPTRPLIGAAPGLRIRELLEERAAAYAAAGSAIDTARETLDQVAAKVAAYYRENVAMTAQLIRVEAPSGSYPVAVGEGALDRMAELLSDQLPASRRAVVVSDAAVATGAGARVAALLAAASLEVLPATVGRGEASKQIAAVARLWDRFQELGVDRGDVVVAVGGGAGLDAIGFAAATWARGVPWINVPTTTLAMVDASIGGKVAINRDGAKNSVGAFHHPRAVVADPSLLGSLPVAVAREGLAEVVKGAALASPLLLDLLEQVRLDQRGLPEQVSWLVEQAVRIKAAYVAADPEDQGLRQALNLGHTYAHGVEAASDFSVPHGRAVAVGLVAAARLGEQLGLTESQVVSRLDRILNRLGLREPLPTLDRDRVRQAVLADKKRRGGDPVFVVPGQRGATLLVGIDPELALEPLWELLPDPSHPRPAAPEPVWNAPGRAPK